MTRTVLISGCSTGIGRALALEFHARGLQVVATARQLDAISDLQREGLHCLALDVVSAESLQLLLEALASRDLAPDILINNAGYGAMGPLAELPDAVLRQQFEVNVFGLLALTRALLPSMMARGSGLVVNVGSVSGLLVTPFSGAYCASKAAVHALSDALRMELAPFNIKVQVIQPGAIQSEFGRNASAGLSALDNSLRHYRPWSDAIAARAMASQQGATPVAELASAMVDAVLSEHPQPYVRIGHGSWLLPFLQRWLPLPWRDRLLRRRFGLHLAKGSR